MYVLLMLYLFKAFLTFVYNNIFPIACIAGKSLIYGNDFTLY